VLEKLAGGIIVSCQANPGSPLDDPSILAQLAKAAEAGGAVGIRANLPRNIRAVKSKVQVPVIGLYKQDYPDSPVYITPTFREAKEVIEAGADILAIDATLRKRPNGETLAELVERIRSCSPIPLMADIATFAEAKAASELGFDLIATTLVGYTEETRGVQAPDMELIRRISREISTPLIVEGRVHSPETAALAVENGAFAVVVGTAITDITWVTARYAERIHAAYADRYPSEM
jgi:N-acylglucosamine-6-phosphate 2-epimerase